MGANPQVYSLDDDASEVLRGLTSRPKQLPPKLFYDAAGSILFELITEQPEYYLTSTEQSIFERYAAEMVCAAGNSANIIELGAGSAKKTMLILRAAANIHSPITFTPIDVSSFALELAHQRVRSELPEVVVAPLVLDYTRHAPSLAQTPGQRLVLYIGSSIGNFEPMAASGVLRHLRSSLKPGDALLLGTDMRKPSNILLPAYDDQAGVTARFNLNILARLNRELEANFDLERFVHRAIWNKRDSRIEMHLESIGSQRVRIRSLDTTIDFAPGETIHTENSYKFSPAMIEALALNSGFALEQNWSDERGWFTVTLLRA